MKNTKLVSFVLACVLLICQFSFGVFSAPSVYDINGEKTVFVSSFGRVAYDVAREAFKNFDEGIAAIPDGGTLVFAGKYTYNGENIGAGEKFTLTSNTGKSTGNVITFSSPKLFAQSDIKLDAISYQVKKDTVLVMNGNNLELTGDIDAFYTAEYQTNEKKYSPFLNISSGDADAPYSFNIENGNYGTIKLASGKVSADSSHNLSGNFEKLVVGASDGDVNADIVVNITNANIKELVIGAENGKMNGNITVNVTDSVITKLCPGAYGVGSAFSGNAVLTTDNTDISQIAAGGDGKTDAEILLICSDIGNPEISDKAAFSSAVLIENGFCKPAYDNDGALSGIYCFDLIGRSAKSIISGGKELFAENGVYKVTDGVFEAKVVSGAEFSANELANFVKGYADGTFLPQNNMTRAEAITLLNRIVINDEKYVVNGSFKNRFSDVSDSAWYKNYICYFDALGLLERIADGTTICPEQKITRGEFVQLIYNIEKLLYKDTVGVTYKELAKLFYNTSQSYDTAEGYESFSDVAYDNKFNNAIYYSLARGYVTGYAGGTFLPDGNITRAEVVTVVNRMLGRKPTGAGETSFSDISAHWAKGQILAAVSGEGVSWTKSSDEIVCADGKTQAEFLKYTLGKRGTDIQFMISNHLLKTASEALVADDIPAQQKAEISAAIEELRKDAWTSEKIKVLNGSPEDTDTYRYTFGGAPNIREIHLTSNKPETEDVHIVEFNDIHFNYFNPKDDEDNIPALMATKKERAWMAGGTSNVSARSSMRYSRYADLTVLNGDILDHMSHGAKEKTIEHLFRLDNDVMAPLGNHESAHNVGVKTAETVKYEDKFEFLQEFWPHDALYYSKVLKDKVLCVAMENGISYYTTEQVERLKKDIKTARENNYIILIFNHQPVASRNPDEAALNSITGKADEVKNIESGPICREGVGGASADMYDLITSNADVIKCIFAAHYHIDMISKIPATYKDANGNVVDTFITQHIHKANAYDQNGNVLRIVVD